MSLEADFWGPCINSFGEETKQLKYMELMGFPRTPTWRTQYSFDMGGRSVIDIGGGPCSVLLKCENLGRSVVVDPGDWPGWVEDRYKAAGIEFIRAPGERACDNFEDETCGCGCSYPLGPVDLVLVYNVLQHTEDPEKIVANARKLSKNVCMFEWVDLPAHDGHPHELKASLLNEWAGREGRIVELKGESECFGRAWVLGAPPPPPVPGARQSRIIFT